MMECHSCDYVTFYGKGIGYYPLIMLYKALSCQLTHSNSLAELKEAAML